MESGEIAEQIEEESQEAQVLDVDEIPVQLEESYETVTLASPSNVSSGIRGKYYKQTYRPAWEQMPDFKGWLRGVVGEPTRAYCTYCQKTLHAHRLSLLKHTCTIRHQKAAQIHNTRKVKAEAMEAQQIHTVVLEEDITQGEIEHEEGDTMGYTEVASEMEDDDHGEVQEVEEDEEEDEEDEIIEAGVHRVPFEKRAHNFKIEQGKPPVSTHVIDTTRGVAITGLQVSLYKLIDGRWTYINEGITNVNGRFSNFLEKSDFTPGRYKLHYDVDRYFEARKQETLYPFIEIIFDCRGSVDSYHIPVLLSPFGYSTYRES